MIEVAILICVAAIFVILAVRFPKTETRVFAASSEQNEARSVAEAKKILDLRHEKSQQELSELTPVGIAEDEFAGYDPELSKILIDAREKIEGGKYVSAEELLIEAICKDKRCVWAYEKLGEIYLSMDKNISDAEESFRTALKIDADSAPSWYGLGEIYLKDGQLNKAIDCYQKAVNISRSNAEFQAALGKAYLEVRQYGKASKALKRAASLDISNSEYKKLASLAEDKHREHSRASKLS